MYIRLIIILLILSGKLSSQNLTFLQADSATYAQYLQKDWKKLVKTGKQAKRAGYDYHYLNLRMGIAYFKLRQYARAEHYLVKANIQNPTDELNKIYLYFSALENGNIFLAAKINNTISDRSKTQYEIDLHKPISGLYVETGEKFSSNTDSAGNVSYAHIGMSHFPNKNLSIYHGYTYVQQHKNIWGGLQQHQYYVGGAYGKGNGWSLDFSLHGANFQSNYNFQYDSISSYSYVPPQYPKNYGTQTLNITNVHYTGSFNQMSLFKYMGLSYKKGAFSFSVFGGLQTEWKRPKLVKELYDKLIITHYYVADSSSTTETWDRPNIEIKQASIHSQLLSGATISYIFPAERLTLGVKAFYPLQLNVQPIFSPFLILKHRNTKLRLSYFYKGAYVIADNFGAELLNNYDIVHNRISTELTSNIYNNLWLTVFYQFEQKTDAISFYKYNLNSLSLGLKIRL